MSDRPALMLIGHGSRSAAGAEECRSFARLVADHAPHLHTGCGFIEFNEPDLDAGLDALVTAGSHDVVAVPLVLLGAGHLKDDGPGALARARARHPHARFRYARDLGLHPLVLEVVADRAGDGGTTGAVVLVGRGSTDPDANGDLHKAARLLWEGRGFDLVEPAFVSLAQPSVPEALERCRRLGASRITVIPYFLFTGVLVGRITDQAAAWAAVHPGIDVHTGPHLGPDPRLARLVLERYGEAIAGDARMNCDLCIYRVPLPGYEHRVGAARERS